MTELVAMDGSIGELNPFALRQLHEIKNKEQKWIVLLLISRFLRKRIYIKKRHSPTMAEIKERNKKGQIKCRKNVM